jgi:4-aminobutyrate aminotransferase
VYRHDLLEPLAARLAALAPGDIDTFFYANSGAEITEAAVKLAKQATKRTNVIVFSGSFHGRTHLAMAMTTSKTGYRAGYAPLPAGIYVAPFPDPMVVDADAEDDRALAGLRHLLKSMTAPEETAAMILEPVLGEGGYIQASTRFLQGVSAICKEHGIMFIADEVQSGCGRTGLMFAIQHSGVVPDIICTAKGIASGFPFSVLGASAELMAKWPAGSHGGTYGGNAMGCAAAMATLDILTADGFLQNVQDRGEQLRAGLRELAMKHPAIVQVRGPGLMVATQFEDPARVAAVIKHCLDHGKVILMNAGTYGNVIRWMPPLVVTEAEITHALAVFSAALDATA